VLAADHNDICVSKQPRSRIQPALFALVLLCFAPALPVFGEDFYEQQLRQGKADFSAGRNVAASDELRIAAFGFLDRPPLLSEALVRLTLVQLALSQPAAASQTLNRFIEVERRFPVYASAALEPQARASFDALLLKSIPRADLVAIPSLSRLFRSEAAKVADMPVERRNAAYEAGFRKSPRDLEWPLEAARNAAALRLDEDTIRWSKRVLAIDPRNAVVLPLIAHAHARRGECRDALARINGMQPGALSDHAELAGDQVVCLVKESKWSDADAALRKLPDSERSRTDVAKAAQEIAAHLSPALRPRPSAATTTTAPETAPAQARPRVLSTDSSITPAATTTQAPPVTTNAPATAENSTSTQPAASAAVPVLRSTTDALAGAKSMVRSGRFADAAKLLQPAVVTDPRNRDLRLALLEASSLARDWRTAALQVTAATPFKSGEEASMFYAATALFETGKKEEARQLLERAKPRLPSTPLVDYYNRLILGRK
jgi:tetratricopeptide (TPR) repeat protein